MREDAQGNQYGMCVFEDGSECDEWAYYRGECAPGSTEAVTPTEASPSYVNEVYGFSFNPSSDWAIEGFEDYLLFTRPGYRLFVGYQWADEDPKPFRTGMPQGEFQDAGNATLLGQPIPKQVLVWEGKNKVVNYGGRIKAGSLILVFYLDGVETEEISYGEINIPQEIMDEADQIVASFTLTSGEQPTLEFNP